MLHVSDEIEPGKAPLAVSASRWARTTFAVLFVMNLLDYTDRNILSAVLPQLTKPVEQHGLGIEIDQAGWLATYFLISYSLVSPLMGWAGDRMKRTWLLAFGVGVWSLATVGSGFARNFNQLALARSFLGIGEATYGVIAPTVLLDLFSREQRSRVLSGFYLAMPLGTALGIGLGGVLGERYGWPTAFFIVGVPALAASFAAFCLPEPVRGASEGVDPERLRAHQRSGASKEDYIDLMVNSSYTYAVFGMSFYTFAIGGMVFWVPYYLVSTRGMPQGEATLTLGLVTLGAATLGMTIGGWVSDTLAKKNSRALFIVPGLAMLASIPFVLVALLSHSPPWIFGGIFFAEALMFVNTGPCNAIIANVVAPNLRSSAYAIAIAAVHVLGDFWSPPLIGWVANFMGKPESMAIPLLGPALAALGAVPVHSQNLVAGLIILVPALFISGVVLLAGARHLPREMALMLAKLKAAPRPAATVGPPLV